MFGIQIFNLETFGDILNCKIVSSYYFDEK